MQNPPEEAFSHRANKDGSFDSICLFCYRTVATASNEADLRAAEASHSCSQKLDGTPGLAQGHDPMADRSPRPPGELRRFRRKPPTPYDSSQ
jgi:hypothetical protein